MIDFFEQLLKKIRENPQDYKIVTYATGDNNLNELAEYNYNILENELGKIMGNNAIGRVVFRGQTLTNEAALLNVCLKDNVQYNIEHELYPRLFNIGEKAKDFYKNKVKIKKRGFVATPDECDELFDDIREKLNKAVKGIVHFCEDEPDFINFFKNIDNKLIFKDKLMTSGRPVYAFYKWISHVLGSNEQSMNVSTSMSISWAYIFLGAPKKNDSIIIGYVVPNSSNYNNRKYPFSQRNDSLFNINYKLIKLKLPFITKHLPFSGQREVSVTGCLFPHLIWFVIDICYKRIIINPYIFNEGVRNESVFIDIDQSNFKNEMELTRYRGYITYYSDYGEFVSDYIQ